MPRSFPAFCFCLLVQGWLFACHAAETPAAAVEEFLAALRGKDPVEVSHPAMVVSPFCPAEKKTAYNTGLRELAGQVEGATSTLQPVREPDKLFAGYMLVLRQKANPLQVIVRPVCVLKTGKGWKVPAGVSHFDNTHFGFEPGLDEAAVAVSSATIAAAAESGRRMLEEGAENLWKEIRARRATWPADEPPDALIRRFLDFDLANDAVGKLASFHITPDLTAASLERFLSLLGSETFLKAEGDDTAARALPWAVEIAGKEGKSQILPGLRFPQPDRPVVLFSDTVLPAQGRGQPLAFAARRLRCRRPALAERRTRKLVFRQRGGIRQTGGRQTGRPRSHQQPTTRLPSKVTRDRRAFPRRLGQARCPGRARRHRHPGPGTRR